MVKFIEWLNLSHTLSVCEIWLGLDFEAAERLRSARDQQLSRYIVAVDKRS